MIAHDGSGGRSVTLLQGFINSPVIGYDLGIPNRRQGHVPNPVKMNGEAGHHLPGLLHTGRCEQQMVKIVIQRPETLPGSGPQIALLKRHVAAKRQKLLRLDAAADPFHYGAFQHMTHEAGFFDQPIVNQ